MDEHRIDPAPASARPTGPAATGEPAKQGIGREIRDGLVEEARDVWSWARAGAAAGAVLGAVGGFILLSLTGLAVGLVAGAILGGIGAGAFYVYATTDW